MFKLRNKTSNAHITQKQKKNIDKNDCEVYSACYK